MRERRFSATPSSRRTRRVRGIVSVMLVVLTIASVIAVARRGHGQAVIGLSSYEHFTVEYTTDTGGPFSVTEADAVSVSRFPAGPFLVTLFVVPIGRTGLRVWVGLFAENASHAHFAACYHPGGKPASWRMNHIEQRFDIAFLAGTSPQDLRFVMPRVYGPTSYSFAQPQTLTEAYPTFLQAQIVVVEDELNGGALALSTDDDSGRRKRLGFVTDGTLTGAQFVARYVPDQGQVDPLPPLWSPGYSVRFSQANDLDAALDWYRSEQLKRPQSFLRRRKGTLHPDLARSKFSVAIGASLSTVQLASGQFDLSAGYRRAVLDYFQPRHGKGMQLYHLGWSQETPGLPAVMPESFETITAGHAAMIGEAAAKDPQARSIAYTLPGVIHPKSMHYDAELIRQDIHGAQASISLPGATEQSYFGATYFPQGTTDVYTTLYVNHVLTTLGFSGAYLDAISAWPMSYSFFRDGHPSGQNEQLIGIDRLLSAIRSGVQSARQYRPILYQETPTDCMSADSSAIDLYTWDDRYQNVFRRIYEGAIWPVFGVVWGWDDLRQEPSGLEFARELANVLAGGARPMILWPEIHGAMPSDPGSDPAFADFASLFDDYVANYDAFWKSIIEGRLLQSFDPNDILGQMIIPGPRQASSNPAVGGDPVTSRWRLPGRRPDLERGGSAPSPLRGQPSDAFFSGLFEPAGRPGARCLVIVRWASPAMAVSAGLAAGDPLHQQCLTCTVRLSARNVGARPGAAVRLLDVRSGTVSVHGRLGQLGETDADASLTLSIPFYGPGAKALLIE